MTFSSCGYHISESQSFNTLSTVSVPYVKGDLDGRLTRAIIKKLSCSSNWVYTKGVSDLVLEIEVLKNKNDYIGYQYDRVDSPGAPLINRLVPNEGRQSVLVKVSIYDSHKQKILQGPFEVEAFADYDFVNFDTYKDLAFVNAEGIAQSVLTFSLGQLDASEDAQDAVLSAVYESLAEKVVSGLENL
jgi:hypothetical protein